MEILSCPLLYSIRCNCGTEKRTEELLPAIESMQDSIIKMLWQYSCCALYITLLILYFRINVTLKDLSSVAPVDFQQSNFPLRLDKESNHLGKWDFHIHVQYSHACLILEKVQNCSISLTEPTGNLVFLEKILIWSIKLQNDLWNTKVLCTLPTAPGHILLWMDSSTLKSSILGTLELSSRDTIVKSHTLKHRSHQFQNKIKVFHICAVHRWGGREEMCWKILRGGKKYYESILILVHYSTWVMSLLFNT